MNPSTAISASPSAVNYIEQCLQQKQQAGNAVTGVRFGVKKTGCSGFGYQLEFITEPNADDHRFPIGADTYVAVDPKSFALVKGTRLDYQVNQFGGVMKFFNPNQTGSCGCGESFTVSDDEK